MTERGLPLADGAPACPFVAFEDDRDERSSVPDHRHRCYADARPSPRALAHQEAYCLSSAFPVCPTFQDWARREAARSRGGAPTAPSASAGMNRAASGAVADPADRAGAADAAAIAAGTAGFAAATAGLGATDPGSGSARADVTAVDPTTPDDRHTAPATAFDDHGDDDRGGGGHHAEPDLGLEDRHTAETDADHGDDRVRRNPPRDWAAPPPWLASNERRSPVDDADPPAFLGHRATDPGQGLAGSPADRMAGGQPPRRADSGGDWSSESRSAAAIGAGIAASGAASGAGDGPDPGRRRRDPYDDDESDGRDDHEGEPGRIPRRPRAYAQHLGGPDGPDWEQPRRYEAYPTLKSRVTVGMPGIPRIGALALLVLVIAIGLFLLPGILNLGGAAAPPAGSPGASQAGGAAASASVAPTAVPAPTPQIYTIKKGDVLSKVAAQHGVTIEELLAANPTIKNPNRISEGQQIVIPVPSEAPPDTVGGSGAP